LIYYTKKNNNITKIDKLKIKELKALKDSRRCYRTEQEKKEYYKNNTEKVKAQQKEYYENNAEKRKEYIKNTEKIMLKKLKNKKNTKCNCECGGRYTNVG
jgi:hypothetical protein